MSITTEAHWELSGGKSGRRYGYAVATVKGSTPAETRNAAHDAARLASKKSPVRTGRLSRSYGVTGTGTELTIRSAAPYSSHVEWGHKKPNGGRVPAKPHLRPALKAVEAKYNAPARPARRGKK
jgi:hypothetical protein